MGLLPQDKIWRNATSIAATVAVLWAAPLASQQASLTVGQIQQITVAAIQAGNGRVAVDASNALLERNPNQPGLLILRTEAALTANDFAGAIQFGRQAYWNARSGTQRFAAARLIALAHSRLGQDTRAQGWLRLARQDAPNDEARAEVARDFRFLRARNPLAVNLRFGVTPTTNVNNGSSVDEDEAITLFGLTGFTLDGEARALSGWEVSGSANLQYRIRNDETSATFLTASLAARTYVLSESAQEQAGNDVSGSDFSDANLSLGVTHRFVLSEGMRPTTASLSFGQSWYGGEPTARLRTVSASQPWEISPQDTFILSGFAQDQESLTGGDPIKTYSVQGTWARDLEDLGNVSVSLALRDSQSDNVNADYDGIRYGVNYSFPEPIAGFQLGLSYSYEERDFEVTNFSPRDVDIIRTASVRAVMTDIEVLGFQPVINIERTIQDSDAGLFDREYTNFGFDITSSF